MYTGERPQVWMGTLSSLAQTWAPRQGKADIRWYAVTYSPYRLFQRFAVPVYGALCLAFSNRSVVRILTLSEPLCQDLSSVV